MKTTKANRLAATKVSVEEAFVWGFEEAKAAARQIIEAEIVNNYTDSRNTVSVLSQVSKSISELKPEVSSNG